MAIASFCRRLCGTLAVLAVAQAESAVHAGPTVEEALRLKPTQKDVEYVMPDRADIEKCTIKPAEKAGGQTGWVIRDGAGQVLRRFVDTNADVVVDQWSYYLDGLEVYRDIDSDFNGKPDQCRWFNTAGVRWGVDKNEDGKIDYWKAISAEEVSAEIVAALADRDAARFARLVLTAEELKTLGLSDARVKDIETKAAGATEEFRKVATTTKTLTGASRWLQFGGTRPGIVPAGTDGSTKDLVVYENGVAVVQTGDKTAQLQIGTMIRVGDAWRLIGAPGIVGENDVVGEFFTARNAERTEEGNATNPAGGPPQPLLTKLEQIDKAIDQTANPQEQAKLTADKAAVIEQIAEALNNSPDDRAQWIRQLADMTSAAVQSNVWPEGVEKLKSLYMGLAKDPAGEELAAYVEFRYLTAEYGRGLASGTSFEKVQANWLTSLEKYVQDHPKSADTAEAMLQLAIAQEFAGQETEAKSWYGQIRDRFGDSPTAKKAAGALTRLDSVGRVIRLKGANIAGGKPIDLAQFKDKVVLIQYWATWCEPAKIDLAQLKEVQAKYGKDLAILGVSLDSKPEDLVDYLKQNRLPWPQIFEPGGLDSRLANEMGILTLPTMILVGKDGKVVNRGIHITELEREVGNLLSTPQAKK